MQSLNTAQKLLQSLGGVGHIMAIGYYVDRTTMPKNQRDRKENGKRIKKVSYGASIMAQFDIIRHATRTA